MVKTENLTFLYQSGQSIFNFPDISLKDNEDLLIIGKSGIGKTTLLHLLAGLLRPHNGSITINNTEINTLKSSKLDHFRGQKIGLVFQKNHAIQSLNVFENLKARLFFSNKPINKASIEALLNELDLYSHKNKKPKELSQGQLQRLNIAMSVIHEPKVIMADEPTSSLDDDNCKIVVDVLKNQATKNNANLIVITHDHRVKSYFQHTIAL